MNKLGLHAHGRLFADFAGTPGDDSLVGTTAADTISGLGGDDTLRGLGGDDSLLGGDGDDVIDTGGGDDTVRGGVGADVISIPNAVGEVLVFGEDGDDEVTVARNGGGLSGTIDGGAGDDSVSVSGSRHSESWLVLGGDGNDRLHASKRMDTTLDGGAGDDVLSSARHLRGGEGNDTLFGGRGDADGGAGDDVLWTYLGFVTAVGGEGNDIFFLDRGADVLVGGEGTDTIQAPPGRAGNLHVELGAGTASFDGTTADTVSGIENVVGTRYGDVLRGDASDNLLIGNSGADFLDGDAANDTLVAGTGNDTLRGGGGGDTFVFTFPREHDPVDRIVDLRRVDVIDLSGIDADKQTDGDQAFHLVDEFGNGRGELVLRWVPEDGITYLEGQFGNGGADFTIELIGKHDHFPGIIF